MFEDVRDLYSETILQRSRAPRFAGRPEAFSRQARGDNPLCGDRVTVFVRGGEVVEGAGYEARGCELVRASADLMCEAVAGLAGGEVRRLAADVEVLARTGVCAACDAGLQVLGAVHEYPSRVRCVTLPWAALVAALDGKLETAA